MRHFAFLIVLSLATCLWAERQPFERYRSIVDRQMFGPLPPDFDPEKMPSEVKGGGASAEKQMTQEQEKLQASVRFFGIRVSPEEEVFVSFSDTSDPKKPRSYYMKVGETSNGWTVLEADPVKATMTVEKDGVEVSLTIGGTSGGKDGAGVVKAAAGAAPAARAPMNAGLLGGSLRNRRLLRQQREAEANREAEAKRQQEQAEREAEKAQREAEREEQRRQLQAIQDELRKARESKEQHQEEAKATDGQNES